MAHFKLANISAYAFEDKLLISSNDDKVLTLAGRDVPVVKKLIHLFREQTNSEDIFELIKHEVNESVDFFQSLINYLVKSSVLIPISDPDLQNHNKIMHKKTLVIGKFCNKEVIEKLLLKLNKPGLSYSIAGIYDSLQKLDLHTANLDFDLVILFSPLLENTNSIFEFSNYLQTKNIPLIHGGIENYSLIVGPILDPNLFTPGLSCYFRRKLASFQKPDIVLSVFKSGDLSALVEQDLSNEPLIHLLLEFIGFELEKHFLSSSSSIVAKEVEIDCLRYQARSTRILKTHFFRESKTVNPFNN